MKNDVVLNPFDKEIIQFIENKCGSKFKIFTDQLKWNDTGIYVKNNEILGIALYNQKINELPNQLWDLPKIELLSIVNTLVPTLPNEMGNLSSLNELYIGGNNWKTIPETIANLINLKFLYLLEDQLGEVPDLTHLKSLEELSISSTKIELLGDFTNTLIENGCRIYFNNEQITKQ
jgi:Leucine-rich repeat (LRR) protein